MQIEVRHPALDELVYTVLYEMPYEIVRQMEPKIRKACWNEKGARKFARTCTREEAEYVMAMAGMEFFYIVAPKNLKRNMLVDLVTMYAKNQRGKALDHIASNHIFVNSESSLMRTLSMVASSMGNPNYFLNVELIRAGQNLKKWRKRNISQEALLIREAEESASKLAASNLNAILVCKGAEHRFKMSELQVTLMLKLYSDYGSVEYEKLVKEFRHAYSAIAIKGELNNLIDSHFVTRSLSDSSSSYKITGLGIKRATEIVNEINL